MKALFICLFSYFKQRAVETRTKHIGLSITSFQSLHLQSHGSVSADFHPVPMQHMESMFSGTACQAQSDHPARAYTFVHIEHMSGAPLNLCSWECSHPHVRSLPYVVRSKTCKDIACCQKIDIHCILRLQPKFLQMFHGTEHSHKLPEHSMVRNVNQCHARSGEGTMPTKPFYINKHFSMTCCNCLMISNFPSCEL